MTLLLRQAVLPLAIFAGPLLAGGLTPSERQAGAELYQRCQGCHALAYDRTGPRHCGLFGRRAGSLEGYGYSQAMRDANIVWSRQTLDRFLAGPLEMIPGTTMGYAGIAESSQRALLIGYLEWASTSATLCPNQ